MANVIDSLVIRIVGDNKKYMKMIKETTSATGKFTQSIDGKLRNAQGQFVTGQNRMQAELSMTNNLFKKGAILADFYGKKLKTAGAGIRARGASVRAGGSKVRGVGLRASLAVTAPIVAIGAVSVKAFANFDKAMTESISIMKVTETQIKAMRTAAIELSAGGAILQSPKELAESYFFLASAGKDAEQAMALLPKVAAFATAGNFDMALATDLLTDAQSALGLSSKNTIEDTINLTRVSDVLVKANTLANASVRQFSTSLTSKAGAALKAWGKDVEEGVAVLAALADQGVKAELSGNALDRIIRLSAKGALDNAKAHKELGFEVFDVSGKMNNLGDIIANLEQVLDGMSDKQRAITLDMLGFEARVQGVILPLLGTSKAIKQYEKELRNAGGTTEDVANKQMKSFSAQIKILKNQLTVFAIEIGEILAPTILRIAETIKVWVKVWRNLAPETKKIAVVVALVVASIGPLLVGIGSLVSLVGFAISGLGAMLMALGFLISPVALLTVTVTALGITVLHWTGLGAQALQWFAQQWTMLVNFVKPAIDGITNALKGGDMQLAMRILWLQLELIWKKGLQPLEEAWIGFTFVFKKVWLEALTIIKKAYQETVNFLAIQLLKIQAKFDKSFDLQDALDALTDMNNSALNKIVSDRKKALDKMRKDVGDTLAVIDSDIRKLQARRNKAITKAADAVEPKAVKVELLAPILPKIPGVDAPPIPSIVKEETRIALREATTFQGPEALSRVREFLDAGDEESVPSILKETQEINLQQLDAQQELLSRIEGTAGIA